MRGAQHHATDTAHPPSKARACHTGRSTSGAAPRKLERGLEVSGRNGLARHRRPPRHVVGRQAPAAAAAGKALHDAAQARGLRRRRPLCREPLSRHARRCEQWFEDTRRGRHVCRGLALSRERVVCAIVRRCSQLVGDDTRWRVSGRKRRRRAVGVVGRRSEQVLHRFQPADLLPGASKAQAGDDVRDGHVEVACQLLHYFGEVGEQLVVCRRLPPARHVFVWRLCGVRYRTRGTGVMISSALCCWCGLCELMVALLRFGALTQDTPAIKCRSLQGPNASCDRFAARDGSAKGPLL